MPRLLSMIIALMVGGGTFILLLAEGVPAGQPALPGKRIKLTHTTRSHCSSECREPERSETRVTLSSLPATPADAPSVIEKAIDNDGGVLVIRFIVAILTALATVATIERLLRRPPSGGPSTQGSPAELGPDNGRGSHGSKGERPADIEEVHYYSTGETAESVAEEQLLKQRAHHTEVEL